MEFNFLDMIEMFRRGKQKDRRGNGANETTRSLGLSCLGSWPMLPMISPW